MEQEKIAKQMIDFQKAAFDNSFNAMVMVQEQTERMVNMALEQATWLPEEGRKVVGEWVKAYEKGRKDLKKTADENFNKIEAFFAGADKAQKQKAK